MSDDTTKRPADASHTPDPDMASVELLYRLVRELPLARVLQALED